MKVKELIEQLSQADPEKFVIISRDGEGNGYSDLADVSINNNSWNFDGYESSLGLEYLTPILEGQGYTEEDIIEGIPVVVLWP